MPVFILNKSLQMPSPALAESDGLLAIGGDLRPERLLNAYQMGIFPWYNQEEEILWWSPDPRCVLFPDELKVSKSMQRLIKQGRFKLTYNQYFNDVIKACKQIPRADQNGTWITEEMEIAYTELHHLNIAKSVEVWEGDQLVGGLYGLLIGKVFFGESMFSKRNNASKFAFIHWVERLKEQGVALIDCQQETAHLLSLGARSIARKDFLLLLKQNCLDKYL
jgi:leucyl/phenylalanyl-tRNA--protein transferase